MAWNTRYIPPDPKPWHGRADALPTSYFFQIMQMCNLLSDTLAIDHADKTTTFALIGFKCEEGIRRNVGRVGAAEGPPAIRRELAKLPIHRSLRCFDVGDIVCTDGDLESSQAALAEVVALLLDHHITPIVLGGGHELAWGHYQGIVKTYTHQSLGILNFDAHFDMRPLLPEQHGSSGTPFLQMAEAHAKADRRFDYNCIGIQQAGNTAHLFETAKRYGVNFLLADELHEGHSQKTGDFLDRVIDQNETLYVSLCLDVFSAAVAPGVSAIQPFGLLPWHVIPLLRQAAASGKVVSYDIAELSPRYDIDHRTAKLAAYLIYDIVHHVR